MCTQYLYSLGRGYIPFLASTAIGCVVCIPQPRKKTGSGNPREKRVQAGREPVGMDLLLVADVV